MLKISAMYQLCRCAIGGSLVHQISTSRPRAELLTVNVYVPPTSLACATVVIADTVAGERRSLLPILIWTSAPGIFPKVICSELSRTGLPMSRISPVPCLRPPKYGLPSYHWVYQSVEGLPSMASGAHWLFSSPASLRLSASKPCALTGLSTATPEGPGELTWWRA